MKLFNVNGSSFTNIQKRNLATNIKDLNIIQSAEMIFLNI